MLGKINTLCVTKDIESEKVECFCLRPSNKGPPWFAKKNFVSLAFQSGNMDRECSSKLKCRKSGSGTSHNSLLHDDTSSSAVSRSKNANDVTSCTVSRARKGALQVIEIGLRSDSSNTKAMALCDTGSTH